MQRTPPLLSDVPAQIKVTARGSMDIVLRKGTMTFEEQRDLARALLVELANDEETTFRIKHPEAEWVAEQLNGALWPSLRIHIAHLGDPEGYSRHTMEGPVPTEAIASGDEVIIHAMRLNEVTREEMAKYPRFRDALKALEG